MAAEEEGLSVGNGVGSGYIITKFKLGRLAMYRKGDDVSSCDEVQRGSN